MTITVFQSIKNRLRILHLFMLNLWEARKIKALPSKVHDIYTFTGLPRNLVTEVDSLHRSLRKGRKLGFWKKTLLMLHGSALCGIILNAECELMGFQLHFFKNKDELAQGILHIEYSCINPVARGQGLSSALRRHMAKHYASVGLKGLSAYTNGIKNLAIAEHIGYKIVSNLGLKNELTMLYFDLTPYKDSTNSSTE